MRQLRKYLSISGLLSGVRQTFLRVSERCIKQKRNIKIVDCLMGGVAIFGLKFPSLLQYDTQKRHLTIEKNLKKLYGVGKAPSDTYLREELDQLEPKQVRPAFKKIWSYLQRGKALVPYVYWKNYYLISIDGTGQFSSDSIFCKNCCVKHHKNGKTSYYHQMLGAVLLHPDRREVIPLAPEPIIKSDGSTKNDCERNAGKRLLNHIRREHPHLKMIITEDGLSSNGPHIQLLKELDMRFILGAKPEDHAFLFDWVNHSKVETFEKIEQEGVHKRYRWLNRVPLNEAQFDCEVNFLEYWETGLNGKQLHWSWVTDIPLDLNTLDVVMRGGRARWKIENETFNTLKTQGYHFEHNFGHGENQLCSVMTMLMMLSFLIDQVQALASELFRQARLRGGSKQTLWESMRVLFQFFEWESWERLFITIAERLSLPNTG
jgi:hypothetical protein